MQLSPALGFRAGHKWSLKMRLMKGVLSTYLGTLAALMAQTSTVSANGNAG